MYKRQGGDNLSAPDTTTPPSGIYSPWVSSGPSTDGDLSAEGSEASSSDESSPIPTMVRLRRANFIRTCLDMELTRGWNKLERGREHLFEKLAW